jgi:hypothetical protein
MKEESVMGNVELGDEVKEVTTGMQGIAIARHNHMYGCVRISIQPPAEPSGKYVDSWAFDALQLEIMTKGKVKYIPNEAPKMVMLGDKVRDKITDFKGIAVVRSEYLSGGDRIQVQGKLDKDGKIPEDQSFDEPQLEILVSAKAGGKKEESKTEPKTEKQERPYGPERYKDQGRVNGGSRDVAPRR